MRRRDDSPEWRKLRSQALEALDSWLADENCSLTHRRWFTTGRSPDLVGTVERYRPDDGSRQLVVKFWERGEGQPKTERFLRAYEEAPSDFRVHLPTLEGDAVALGPCWMIWQQVAGGDLSTVLPLTELVTEDDPGAAECCRAVARSIVGDWNSGPGWHTTPTSVGKFLETILGQRIDRDGTIWRWADDARIGTTGDPPVLPRPGWDRPLPNPFALLNQLPLAVMPVASMALGKAHGDLNGRNILVPGRPRLQPDGYALVDLERYENAAPLARDPMHLLVSLVMDLGAAKTEDTSVRRDLVTAVVDPDASGLRDVAEKVRLISDAVREGTTEAARVRGSGHDWPEQCLLSLVAAGLMHVGRRWFAPAEKQWCYDLAAVAAERFLSGRGLTIDAAARPVVTVPDRTVPDTLGVEGGPMDTLRVYVMDAGADGARFREKLARALANMPVELAPHGGHGRVLAVDPDRELREEIAQADAVMVVLTTELLADAKHASVVERASARKLPILCVRLHPVEIPHGLSCFDVAPDGSPPWDELRDELRQIGSPTYLEDRYTERMAWARSRYGEGHGRSRKRFEREWTELQNRLHDQRDCRQNPGGRAEDSRISEIVNEPVHDAEDRPRHAGQPLPMPPGRPLDRDLETRALRTRLRPPRGAVALVGPEGAGKTAMVARLLEGNPEDKGTKRFYGVAYLTAVGPHPVNWMTILGALADLASTDEKGEIARAALDGRSVPWSKALDLVAASLRRKRILLVLDDVQELLDAGGQFADRMLGDLLCCATEHEDFRLQLLLISTRPPAEPPSLDVLRLDRGLDQESAWTLLRDMDPDEWLGLDEYKWAAPTVKSLTDGHPRALELLAAVLHVHPHLTLPDVLEEVRRDGRTGPGVVSFLFLRLLEGLDRTQQRVLQAFAVFGVPVRAAAVDALLAPYLPGLSNGRTLKDLVDRRVIRRAGERYLLPLDRDSAELLTRLGVGTDADRTREPAPLNRCALYHRAAEYFADPRTVADLDEVQQKLAEVRLRVEGGDRTKALEVMDRLDTSYLQQTGSTALLLPWRSRIPKEADYLAIHNLSRSAEAYLQQDNPAPAIHALREALELARDQHRLRSWCVLRIQLADAFVSAGDCAVAAEYYTEALELAKAKEWPLQAADARAGLIQCLSEHGRFDRALELYAEAMDRLPQREKPVTHTRLSLLLSLGAVYGCIGQVLEARRVLHQGQTLAEGAEDNRLAGAFLGARAVICLDVGQADVATRLADRAVDIGGTLDNQRLCREAATTLAQAHLCLGEGHTDEARAAADHAVRVSRSYRAIGGLVAKGIAHRRVRAHRDDARQAFADAQIRADVLCRTDPDNYEVHDLLGLASCGLALCKPAPSFSGAVAAFQRARDITSKETIVLRVQRLLTQLVSQPDGRVGPDGRIREVMEAATGSAALDAYP